MTTVAYERKQQERLSFCVANLVICNDMGDYARVPSASGTGDKYIVGINPLTQFAADCTCRGNSEFNTYCVHMKATDIVLEGVRDASAVPQDIARMLDRESTAAVAGDKAYRQVVGDLYGDAYESDTRTKNSEPTYCYQCGRELKGSSYVCGQCCGY